MKLLFIIADISPTHYYKRKIYVYNREREIIMKIEVRESWETSKTKKMHDMCSSPIAHIVSLCVYGFWVTGKRK